MTRCFAFSDMAITYSATTVLPADVCADTSTDWLFSKHNMASFWKGSKVNGYSLAGIVFGLTLSGWYSTSLGNATSWLHLSRQFNLCTVILGSFSLSLCKNNNIFRISNSSCKTLQAAYLQSSKSSCSNRFRWLASSASSVGSSWSSSRFWLTDLSSSGSEPLSWLFRTSLGFDFRSADMFWLLAMSNKNNK